MKKKLYEALLKKNEAIIANCEATLEVYFNNPAGIGEHPQIIDEMDKMVEQMATAQGNIDIIQTKLSQYR